MLACPRRCSAQVCLGFRMRFERTLMLYVAQLPQEDRNDYSLRGPAGLSWGIYFMAYNSAKRRWQRRRKVAHLPPQLHLLSAAEAGCLVSRPAHTSRAGYLACA